MMFTFGARFAAAVGDAAIYFPGGAGAAAPVVLLALFGTTMSGPRYPGAGLAGARYQLTGKAASNG